MSTFVLFRTMLVKDLRTQCRQSYFIIFLVIILAAFVLNALYYSLDYDQQQTAAYRTRLHIEKTNNADHISYLLPPSPCAFMANTAGASYPDQVEYYRGVVRFRFSDSHTYSLLGSFMDFSLESIVVYILSFLVIMVTSQSMSAECHQGALPVLFANPLGRIQFAVIKWLEINVLVGLLLGLGLFFNLAFLQTLGRIPLNGTMMANVALFAVQALLFLNVYILLAMLFSLLFRRPDSTLLMLVVVWTVLNVFLPMAFMQRLQTIPADFSITRYTSYRKQQSEEYQTKASPLMDEFYRRATDGTLTEDNRRRMEKRMQSFARDHEKKLEGFATRLQASQFAAIDDLYRLGVVIPATSFSLMVSRLSDTGFYPFLELFKQRFDIATALDTLVARKKEEAPEMMVSHSYISMINRQSGKENRLAWHFEARKIAVSPAELPPLPRSDRQLTPDFIRSVAGMCLLAGLLLAAVCVSVYRLDLRGKE